jgi:4-hydroxy-4-methyl-2-oxoglutarate aldolase
MDIVHEFEQFTAFEVGYIDGLTRVMDPGIKPLTAKTRVVGTAFTVADKDICMNVLSEMRPNDVLVFGATTSVRGRWGGSISVNVMQKGGRGIVIDGGTFKLDVADAGNAPIFARYTTAACAPVRLSGDTGMPVVCGGVIVRPGDVIVGDRNGVAVVPVEVAEEVLDAMRAVRKGEDFLESEIAAGRSLEDSEPLRELWRMKEQLGAEMWRVYPEWLERYAL